MKKFKSSDDSKREDETPQAPVTPVCSYHTGRAEKLQRGSSSAVEKHPSSGAQELNSATQQGPAQKGKQ